MPVYNRQAYIQKAITSVLNQSYDIWELLIVDDGSNDYSPFIAENFALISEKVKLILQEHKNLPSAKNNGIRNSSGDFITFLDSDDEYKPDHIELRVKYLLDNPSVDLIHGGIQIIGDEFVPDKDNPDRLIHLSKCVIGATFFGRRKVFIDSGGFKDLPYSEDSEFFDRIKFSFNIQKVEFPTYVYHREISDSITNLIKFKK
ncbi:MAG: glycosyltransferase family 2 protein [Ignavibacterium sp.]|uniref:glycosyltransferase family 2 protein n=1 Tax=Ignavibacterium sp. TaxID=2651167 RepID=UPI00404A53E9